MNVEVNDSPMDSQYQAWVDGTFAGLVEYELTGKVITLTHTAVEPDHEGEGVGGSLARYTLDDARARGLGVVALCPFISGWIARHPDYRELLVSGHE
jgi:predicted GNAT family acetyltransferase